MTWRARRFGAAALLVGAGSAVLASAGPDALRPFEDLARAGAAEATVSVAFVVDFGNSASPVVACVKVPSGTNGYQALAAFTSQEQQQAPTYNAAQLLCSINGYPSSGCGQAVNGGYAYWSYWHGSSGSWQYASTGAFGDVQGGDVEGWRFEDPGKANPSDPPPGAQPNYGAICASATSANPPASAPGAPPATPAPAGASPSGTSSSGAAPTPSTSAPGGPSNPAAHPTTSAASPPATVPGAVAGAPTGPSSTGPRPGTHAQSLRAVRASAGPASDNGALPAAVGGGLVLVLAALAFWRWRKRPRMP